MSDFLASFRRSSRDEDVLKYKNRVELVQSHFREIAKLVDKYASTTEKLGQRGVNISDAVYSSFEDLETHELFSDVNNFCKCFTDLQTLREELASTLKTTVAEDFRVRQTDCKETKKEIDLCNDLITKEQQEKQHLQKLKNKIPVNRRKIMESEIRLEKAEAAAKNAKDVLREEMAQFERKKLHDSGRILREFVRTEMQFHACCLQNYTKAYRFLMEVPDVNDSVVHSLKEDHNEKTQEKESDVLFVKTKRRESSSMSISDLY